MPKCLGKGGTKNSWTLRVQVPPEKGLNPKNHPKTPSKEVFGPLGENLLVSERFFVLHRFNAGFSPPKKPAKPGGLFRWHPHRAPAPLSQDHQFGSLVWVQRLVFLAKKGLIKGGSTKDLHGLFGLVLFSLAWKNALRYWTRSDNEQILNISGWFSFDHETSLECSLKTLARHMLDPGEKRRGNRRTSHPSKRAKKRIKQSTK